MTLDISPFFFYLFAGLAIAASLFVILKKNPVTSAFSLVFVFFCFAGIYGMLGAHLLAAIQVLVYTGAVMVLFVFVIMLLNADVPALDMVNRVSKIRFIGTWIAGLCLLAILVQVFKHMPTIQPLGKFSPEVVESSGGNTAVIAEQMFTTWLLPFELTSILLLAALVGIVAIALRKKKGGNI